MVALVDDRHLIGLLKENDGLRLQQRSRTERVAECCRPERVVLVLCRLRVLFQNGRPGDAQYRIRIVAYVIVAAEILTVGVDAAIHMAETGEVAQAPTWCAR